MEKTGVLTITARRGTNVLPRLFGDRLPRLSIDGCEPIELRWGEPRQFVLSHGEHELVVESGLAFSLDTFCWMDDAGVTVDFISAGPRSLLGDRFTYRD